MFHPRRHRNSPTGCTDAKEEAKRTSCIKLEREGKREKKKKGKKEDLPRAPISIHHCSSPLPFRGPNRPSSLLEGPVMSRDGTESQCCEAKAWELLYQDMCKKDSS